MELGSQLSQGLGLMSNFPTPASAALAGAAQVLGALSGSPEALAANPYASHWLLFEPGGCLWGSPLNEGDLTGSLSLTGPIKPNKSAVPRLASTEGFSIVQSPEREQALLWLRRERLSWSLPAGGTRCGVVGENGNMGVVQIEPGDMKPPVTKGVYRVSVINVLLGQYRDRQVAMLQSSSPSFHYIDLRPWGAAEREAWLREAPLIPRALWKATPKPATPISNSPHSKIRKYYAEAKAEHEALLERNREWYAAEKASWLEWKQALAQSYLEQQQSAQLEQAIHEYYANAEDKGEAAQAIASGQVQFSIAGASDHVPSVWVHGAGAVPLLEPQAFDDAAAVSEEPASKAPLLLLGLVAIGALLALGGRE